jgi:hypothetical protein
MEVFGTMRRMILVLTVTALLSVVLLASSGLPTLAQEMPAAPQCSWYENWEDPANAWWEYWCWWPGWGWEYVFWVWD